jgi:hypothetical protein
MVLALKTREPAGEETSEASSWLPVQHNLLPEPGPRL